MKHASRITYHASRITPHASLFLFLFAIYLLTYTPRINSSDGLAMFATAESLVRRGALDIEQIRWMDLQQGTFGLDGLLYSRKGIGVPVGLLPLTWLGLVIPWWGMVSASLLFNAVVTALTAVVLSAYLQQLGFASNTGLIVALTFGLSTLAWPYAKSLFSDPFSGLLLLAAASALLKYSRGAEGQGGRGEINRSPAPPLPRSPALLPAFLAGLFLGWNIATRYAEAVFVPVFGLLLLYYLLNVQRLTFNILPALLAFSAPILTIGLGLIAFNLSRYGDPFNTGYLPNETFSGLLWQGLAGQLFSPGRGLFLYCPIFLLSLVGFWPFFRRYRPEAIVTLSVIVIHLLLYGKWFMWHGGYAWGPRFLVPTLPFWAVFLAPVAAKAFPAKRGGEDTGGENLPSFPSLHRLLASSPHRLIFLSLAGLGLIPQLLSVAIDFAPFQNSLLETGLPLFDPQTFFDPQFSPFIGAWHFVSLDSLDLAWLWQGRLNGWLLLILIANIILTAYNLRVSGASEREKMGRGWDGSSGLKGIFIRKLPLICSLFTLGTVALLLTYAHTLPPPPLQQAVAALNEGVRPADAVITNDPEITMPFAELYKGRAPVLGLQSGGHPLLNNGGQRVREMIANHAQIWWLPGGLAPDQSAVEEILMMNGFRARNDTFEGERLALFAFPRYGSVKQVAINVIFAEQIKLSGVDYLPQAAAGAALPVQLNWQALTPLNEDYHVFIHLVNDTGQLTAQADGQPGLWFRPTSTWATDETVGDRHGLWLPPQTAPGNYALRVGLYRPADGQRLHLTSGGEFVELPVTIY
ncbi:MAG: hypothetical protein DPW09_09610 [Anaerolineae bacterium]|nr:hypothetical protein [Anaerolineae bacterium]